MTALFAGRTVTIEESYLLWDDVTLRWPPTEVPACCREGAGR